jgi:hypothetical protein
MVVGRHSSNDLKNATVFQHFVRARLDGACTVQYTGLPTRRRLIARVKRVYQEKKKDCG